jgi:hypothetical protein
MASSAPFRLNRSGLLFVLISAAFAGQAGAAAGRVDFAVGNATVVGTDGRSRPVARGTELDSGDTVRTAEGRVQLRMTDGSFISLQPNSEFGIKNYRFEGKTDGTESAFYSLVKGAMRTVTGLVGRVNRNAYRVATPTATVGIRGTGGLIQVLPDGSTLVQGTSGIWFLSNPSGSIDIPAGVSGLAPADPKQPPQETSIAPLAGPMPPLNLPGYVQGEQRTPSGGPVLTASGTTLSGVLTNGSGYAVAMAFSDNLNSPVFAFGSNATATFDAAGRMIDVPNLQYSDFYTLGTGGSHAEFGTDGILAWGRWIGPATVDRCGDGCSVSVDYSANQGLHYVVGIPTAVMPQTGLATYTLLGATRPTYTDGSGAPGTLSGRLSVDFGQFTVGTNLNVAMADGKGYAIGGSAQITGNLFSATDFSGLTVSGTAGAACSSGCNALVNGFFAGASAERAGLGYHISDSLANKNVVGAAAFTKQ